MFKHDNLINAFLICIYFCVGLFTCGAKASAVTFDASYFKDLNQNTQISTLLSSPHNIEFISAPNNNLSFGWVDKPYWFKLDIHSHTNNKNMSLVIAAPLLDHIEVYAVNTLNQVVQTYSLGDKQPFNERPFFDARYVMPIPFEQHNIAHIYIRTSTTSSMHLPINFLTLEQYLKERSIYLTTQGVFYGLILVMIFYNLFIYFSTQRAAYIYYVLFVSSFAILQLGLTGFGFQFIWPNSPNINDYTVTVGGSFSLLFLTIFARSFLQLDAHKPLLQLNNIMVCVAVLFVIGACLLRYQTIVTPLAIIVILFSFIVLIKGFVRYAQGFKEARFYLFAWVAISLGCLIYLLTKLGLLPINTFTQNALQIGSALEVVLLSLALADRLKTLRTRLTRINEQLEKQVIQRTSELNTTLKKLENVNNELAKRSITDSLTGAYNRYHFDKTLDHEISRSQRNKSPLSILLIDLDHFKKINDTYGHITGDNVLAYSVKLLTQICSRKTDIICRYGGEEFVIILPDTQGKNAVKIAQSICDSFNKQAFKEGETHIKVTVSIGLSATECLNASQPMTYELLIHAADQGLYKAKQQGRNRVYYPEALGKNLPPSQP